MGTMNTLQTHYFTPKYCKKSSVKLKCVIIVAFERQKKTEMFACVVNLLYFCDGFNIYSVMMTNKISSEIAGMVPGKVFFPSDLAKVGMKSSNILKILERATNAGTILRLAQGIYYYPKTDDKYGLGIIYPSYEEVAERIAERDKVDIVPTGAYALNKLGFSTQVPMNIVYLTDGASKTIKMNNGSSIRFVHTAQKNLAYKNKLLQMLVFALKDIGKGNITEEQETRIRELLQNIPLEQISEDLGLMPAWIKEIILKQYEQQVF